MPYLAHADDGSALFLVEDALRTHDTRLIAAAVGPYASAHLSAHAWRHAVLKCLFTGVPTDSVHGLDTRAPGDAELARMLADYAAERTAAGRPVPADLHHVLTRSAQSPAPASNPAQPTGHSQAPVQNPVPTPPPDSAPTPPPDSAPKAPVEES